MSNPDHIRAVLSAQRRTTIQYLEKNLTMYSDEQLRHIMDMCEVEIVNRMAAAAGYNDPDEHSPD